MGSCGVVVATFSFGVFCFCVVLLRVVLEKLLCCRLVVLRFMLCALVSLYFLVSFLRVLIHYYGF